MMRCESESEDHTFIAGLNIIAIRGTDGVWGCLAAEGDDMAQSGHSCMQALRDASLQTGVSKAKV